MKRIACIIVALILCISLCACGTSVPEPTPNPAEVLYEKYSGIIDALEAEDYETAVAKIISMVPEPEYEEIVITPDNFWDYCEYREDFSKSKDSFGDLKVDYSSISCGFALKDEYAQRLETKKQSKIALAFLADSVFEMAEIDAEAHSFEWTGNVHETRAKDDDVTIFCQPEMNCYLVGAGSSIHSSTPSGLFISYERLQNIQITRAEGTLFLKPSN